MIYLPTSPTSQNLGPGEKETLMRTVFVILALLHCTAWIQWWLVVWSSSNGLLPAQKKAVDGFFCFVIGILVLFLESLRNIT
jgi:hypothetical protein